MQASTQHDKLIFVIKAESSGHDGDNLASISINNVAVQVLRNEHNHHRGLHIVLINTYYGIVEAAYAFDTYKTSAGFDAFAAKRIPEGYIIVAACKDDCVTQLSKTGKQWFADLGSKEIWNLEYRQGFAFVGLSGKVEANEKRALDIKDRVRVTQVFQINARTMDQETSFLASELNTTVFGDKYFPEGKSGDLQFGKDESGFMKSIIKEMKNENADGEKSKGIDVGGAASLGQRDSISEGR